MAESSSPEVPTPGLQQWSWSTDAGKKVPSGVVPERRSSKLRRKEGSGVRSLQETEFPLPPPPPPHGTPKRGSFIRSRGRSSSPLRRQNSYVTKAPLKTFVPESFPTELLHEPIVTHSRILLDVRLCSPIFMGGATVEGEIHLVLDGGLLKHKPKSQPPVSVSKICATVVGIERCRNKQAIFRTLMVELLNEVHPLPLNMIPQRVGDGSWTVQPSSSIVPFRLDLPVMMGPPPYRSKKVGIEYLVSIMVEATIGKKKFHVRQSKEIVILTVHDPEKALVNLSSPLTVADEMRFSSRQGVRVVALAAGIHRQTWIGGYPIFVDVQVDNRSESTVRKIELQIEKTTTFHDHSAPSDGHGIAESLRLPDQIHKEIVASKVVSSGLRGILPISKNLATYYMDLPTGLLSIETGRFFGVRFFLNVKITCSFNKHLKIQLPITIVHPNSIDIPTNALAQVAASIEHKHRNLTSTSGTGSPYRYRPGQAFTSARRQSYLQLRKNTLGSSDLDSLTRALEDSPRRLNTQSRTSPKRMKITRRQSAVAMSTNDAPGSSHKHHRTLTKQNTSFGNGIRYHHNPRISNDTTRLGEPRVSFEDQAHYLQPLHLPQPQAQVQPSGLSKQQQPPPTAPPRSSLEAKIHKGLRGISMDMMNRGPRLQKSTSGLAFDFSDESEKENISPLRK